MKAIQPRTFKGPENWFRGDVYPTFILAGEEPSRVFLGKVHFSPRARTAWHSHAVGQYLHVTEGVALVQERGGEPKLVRAGETVYAEPDVQHWHGAAPDAFMEHYAVSESPAPDSGIEATVWLEHVTDEDYETAVKEAKEL